MSSLQDRWTPTDPYVTGTRLHETMRLAGVDSYEDFLRLSTTEPERFWLATSSNLGYEWFAPWRTFRDSGAGVAFTRWFVGGTTNAAHNAVDRWLVNPVQARARALVEVPEAGEPVSLTYAELAQRVRREATALRSLGIGESDRAALLLPLGIDGAVLLLALAHVGATAVPFFTGYGTVAVADRLRNSRATTVFVADRMTRRGHPVPLKATLDEALADCPGVKRVVVIDAADRPAQLGPRDLRWREVAGSEPEESKDVAACAVSAMHPLLIAYTSGTTGVPKGIVHTHAGLPLKVAQEMSQIMDIGPGSTLLRITDLGWVGGPYTIFSGLTAGATVVLYPGAPTWPAPNRLWEVVQQQRVTHLGISPTLARQLRQAGAAPPPEAIAALRMTTTTGEHWDEGTYRWYMDNVGAGRLPIVNHSGGTEVGNLLCDIPVRPIDFGAFNSPVPGINLAVLDRSGRRLVGEPGDLVVTEPFVGVAAGLADGDDARFVRTYWSLFPGSWLQGDSAAEFPDGSWKLLGRSDDRIKVSGRSVSPNDVEAAARELDGVAEAALIGVPDDLTGSRLVLFLCFEESRPLAPDASRRAKQELARRLGKSIAPGTVVAVHRLPHTVGGKLSRKLVRDAYLNPDSALSNPDPENRQALTEIAGCSPFGSGPRVAAVPGTPD